MSHPADTRALDDLVARLEQVAARLRDDELEPAAAAGLVEEAAAAAQSASGELERLARAAAQEPMPGQDRLV